MIRISDFKEIGIEVNWRTLEIGLNGPGKFLPQITPKAVVDYAVELVSQNDNQSDNVWNLASLSENDTEEIKKLVWELGGKEASNSEIEKWTVLLLQKLLNELNGEAIYDLLKLTEFWERFDYPEDCPHVVQGMQNDISPNDYYTEENYALVVKNHKVWLEGKLLQLKK